MPSKPLEPGDPLTLGRFELLARLGEGGQGVVYLGRGTGPDEERVAVKVLRSSVDATVLQRLARELDAVHQVQPFVTAGVIEASAEGDRRFIVSEFIDGPSLQERVDTLGPLPAGDLQRLAVGTATALTAIHGAGVVHRDFKPANVLLGPDGPRVVDFGIARLTDAATITSGLIGTPSYVTPEQLAGERPTSAVDVFAWAVTMIFAATGRPAFDADSVPAVMHRIMYVEPDVSGLPLALQPVVSECLNKDPARRPSARDLLLRLVDPSAARPPAGHTDPAPPASHTDPAPPTGPIPSMSGPTGPIPPISGPLMSGHQPTELSRPGAGYEPASLSRPGLGRSRWGPALAASGAVIVAALIVGGVLLLTRGSPRTSSNAAISRSTSSDTGPASQSPTSAAPVTGPTIPSAFAGHWTGTATMAPVGAPSVALQNSIEFTLVAGARTAHENNQSCVNTLTLSQETATVLTFSEPGTAACVAGTVTFTRHGASLGYRWTDNIEQNTATLRPG
jgi:eukaryotic-like serine/threonine-protein kinase